MDMKNEVFQDFKNALNNVDFTSYNPNSTEFITALNLGLMWKLLCKMDETPKDKGVETYVTEVKVHGEQIDDIAKELNGAKVYLQKFMDSGDESYKELAESELKNASILIKKGYSKLPGITEKQKLKEYEEKHDEIMEHLKSM